MTVKQAPPFGLFDAVIVPPIAVTMLWQMDSPSPMPAPIVFVVKKGSKRRESTSGRIPGPLSRTSTTAHPLASVYVATSILFLSAFPSPMAWVALMMIWDGGGQIFHAATKAGVI